MRSLVSGSQGITPFRHSSFAIRKSPISIVMPEIRFQIQWADGSQDICYSPSLIVKEYFAPNTEYALEDFVQRSQTALKIASDRVQAKYGMPCSLALNQLHQIETKAAQYQNLSQPTVQVIKFLE